MASALLPFTLLITIFSLSTAAAGTLTANKPIRDGETLVSTDGGFKLGFFGTGSSKNRYLGIWYSISEETVVWVANREKPLTNSTGVLEIGSDGNLVLRYQAGAAVWSTGLLSNASSSEAQFLDSGNLVLKDGNGGVVWQSFDYPTDTLLGGMLLGWDSKSGLNRRLRSWTGSGDPSPGNYSFEIDRRGSPQLVLKDGSSWVYRTGPWDGYGFSGIPELRYDLIINYSFVSGKDAVYYSYEPRNRYTITRLVMNPFGIVQRYVWINQSWSLYWLAPYDQCDNYGECGPYGVCDTNSSPVCQCMTGFEPKSPEQWNLRDGSSGCVRITSLDCKREAGFLNVTGVKLPDTSKAIFNASMSLEDCRVMCLMNCSCMGYAIADLRGAGSGCIIWVDDLLDFRKLTIHGQNLYVRMAASALVDDGQPQLTRLSGSNSPVAVIVSTSVASTMLLLGFVSCYILAKKKANRLHITTFGSKCYAAKESCSADLAVPLYDLRTMATATNNFSGENKLGEGGFGPVYKGKLQGGQEIAVKRLSKDSVQGLDEFKNEVMLIAKLQHRNLVRLLGCCIQGEERMLIYEYMHNKSLDNFIYDETRRPFLNWQMRFDIIMGIARGLLYLHQDSRFKIVHRDLKASNILLDEQMNPKISDFGVARVSKDNLIDVKTRRIMGTYGYMSPEYAMDGIFSIKSDVFSFGVLVLEIISGKKNRGFYHLDSHLNLIGHAWSLWKEGDALKLVDEVMDCSCPTSQVQKCIQIGLLCVQERAAERPTMSDVVFMLGSPNAIFPQPKQPGFCELRSRSNSQRYPCEREVSCTSNGVTITRLEAR